MSLEFNKVLDQVQKMGRYLAKRAQESSDRMELALEMFYAASDLDAVHERIKLLRESSVSGYRGAAPLPRPHDEVICGVGDPPELPPAAIVAAADGAQVYPDPHAAATYYLLNIGAFVYYHGETRLPFQVTTPELFYSDSKLLDRDGRLITNQTVNARRSVAEVQWLARLSWEMRDEARPMVAIHDGTLLKFFGATEVAGAQEIERDYMDALQKLYDSNARLVGYIDIPRSKYLISLLHLLSLSPDQINDANLKSNGALEGLTDDILFRRVLAPGERSALMTQNSPQNREYKDRKGADYEIAYFYLNVSNTGHPSIARVDVPMWVAKDKAAVDEIHALLLAQCAIQGRKHYPYTLTRADELAYVSRVEKGQLDEVIRVEMMRNRIEPESSNKLQTKGLARGEKRQHRLKV